MSRWNDLYNDHSYAPLLQELQENIENLQLSDDDSSEQYCELSRLKKSISFIRSTLNRIDPELAPENLWNGLKDQCENAIKNIKAFEQNQEFQYLKKANENADTLLSLTCPYAISGSNDAKSLYEATVESANDISSLRQSIKRELSESKRSITRYTNDSEAEMAEMTKTREKINNFERECFGSDEEEGLEEKINKLFKGIEDSNEKVLNYREKLFSGNENNPSISQEFSTLKEKVIEEKDAIHKLTSSVQNKVDSLSDFYNKIYGAPDDEQSKGLSGELKERKEELKYFEEDQKERYKALNDEINSLMPGATATGLAKAYHDMKISFNKPIMQANILFLASIVFLVFISIFISQGSFSGEKWDSFSLIQLLAYKLPMYAPVLWLGIYASRRRSEYHRLQQEYAHKEALAKSYQSYKQQIESLNSEDTEMLENLIKKSIDTISLNAAETLDKHHGDNSPFQEVAEKAARTINK